MKFVILYGTESGNAETVADDLVDELSADNEVESIDMTDAELDTLTPDAFFLVVCSTHGDGGLPASAVPFAELLDAERPDLTGIRYAMFGLGDSSYETYSRGSERIDERLAALGAIRVGEYGRHDASDGSLPNDTALEWARDLVSTLDDVAAVA
ncbi:flavodoxin domain-containing protein [Subtercola endophyticus]|uniref:flavodoxin domain-containing protein n=1 Tax=Subtercola endophyticus TaxID=2895559 RepID=UPI001E5FAE9F|nr:flavodoxin domain-containing protein [Subtercola endophyticus]UFS59155.1 flavodoxin domain-containing protein [Subtercola endophyticus]